MQFVCQGLITGDVGARQVSAVLCLTHSCSIPRTKFVTLLPEGKLSRGIWGAGRLVFVFFVFMGAAAKAALFNLPLVGTMLLFIILVPTTLVRAMAEPHRC